MKILPVTSYPYISEVLKYPEPKGLSRVPEKGLSWPHSEPAPTSAPSRMDDI
jgi:hypothetical protein